MKEEINEEKKKWKERERTLIEERERVAREIEDVRREVAKGKVVEKENERIKAEMELIIGEKNELKDTVNELKKKIVMYESSSTNDIGVEQLLYGKIAKIQKEKELYKDRIDELEKTMSERDMANRENNEKLRIQIKDLQDQLNNRRLDSDPDIRRSTRTSPADETINRYSPEFDRYKNPSRLSISSKNSNFRPAAVPTTSAHSNLFSSLSRLLANTFGIDLPSAATDDEVVRAVEELGESREREINRLQAVTKTLREEKIVLLERLNQGHGGPASGVLQSPRQGFGIGTNQDRLSLEELLREKEAENRKLNEALNSAKTERDRLRETVENGKVKESLMQKEIEEQKQRTQELINSQVLRQNMIVQSQLQSSQPPAGQNIVLTIAGEVLEPAATLTNSSVQTTEYNYQVPKLSSSALPGSAITFSPPLPPQHGSFSKRTKVGQVTSAQTLFASPPPQPSLTQEDRLRKDKLRLELELLESKKQIERLSMQQSMKSSSINNDSQVHLEQKLHTQAKEIENLEATKKLLLTELFKQSQKS